MNYCSKCGAVLKENQYLCPNCGENVLKDVSPDILYNNHSYSNVTEISRKRAYQDKAVIALCYIGFLVIVPILICKYTPYVKFHINQGLALLITEIIYFIMYYIVCTVIMNISQLLFPIVAVLGISGILFIVFALFGIAGAMKNEKRELPLVGGFKILR